MAASGVESQRLITLSLGKIAQSRCQKGGINLHKNLLVATVLHKARTACMIEYQTLQRQRQLQFQQQQLQQQKDVAAALEFEQKQEQARSAALSLAAFNTPGSDVKQEENVLIPTCVRDIEAEDGDSVSNTEVINAAVRTAPVPLDGNLGQTIPVATCVTDLTSSRTLVPSSTSDLHFVQNSDLCDKENAPPCQSPEDVDTYDLHCEDVSVQVVPQSPIIDHVSAATQLAQDAATYDDEGNSYQTSGKFTCNVLKRQREDNSSTHECPPLVKKPRLVVVRRASQNGSSVSHNYTPIDHSTDNTLYMSSQHDSSSSQISNLVSIFNSGFTGLCAAPIDSSLSVIEEDYASTLSCDSHSGHYTTLTPVQPDFCSKISDTSLSCSSSLGRLDTLPAAIGLVLSV